MKIFVPLCELKKKKIFWWSLIQDLIFSSLNIKYCFSFKDIFETYWMGCFMKQKLALISFNRTMWSWLFQVYWWLVLDSSLFCPSAAEVYYRYLQECSRLIQILFKWGLRCRYYNLNIYLQLLYFNLTLLDNSKHQASKFDIQISVRELLIPTSDFSSSKRKVSNKLIYKKV